MLAQAFQFLFDACDALPHAAAIRFQLGFAGAAPADAAHEPVHSPVLAHETGLRVLELGHFHLQFARPGGGPLRENVQNELRAVEDLALRDFGEAVELRGRQFAVENDQRGLPLQRQHFEFREFAFAEDVAGMDARHALDERARDDEPRAAGQLAQFLDVHFLHGAGQGRDGNEHGTGVVARFRGFGEDAAQFFLDGFHFRVEVVLHPIPCRKGMDAVGLTVRIGRQQVGALKTDGIAVVVDGEHGHAVETQEEHVHEVFL